MTVTINDILQTEKMNSAVIIAGEKSIKKQMSRIAAIEKPYVEHPDYCNRVAHPGDIYVSKCYAYQGNQEKLHDELLFMHRTRASGLFIHREALLLFSRKIICTAEKFAIPIMPSSVQRYTWSDQVYIQCNRLAHKGPHFNSPLGKYTARPQR